MKYLIIATIVTLASFKALAQSAVMGAVTKTVTTAGTPERLSANDLYVRCVHLQAVSTNTGIAFVGTSLANAVSGTAYALVKGSATVPATQVSFCPMSAGPRINLKDIWVGVATNGDKVVALYVE